MHCKKIGCQGFKVKLKVWSKETGGEMTQGGRGRQGNHGKQLGQERQGRQGRQEVRGDRGLGKTRGSEVDRAIMGNSWVRRDREDRRSGETGGKGRQEG